MITQTSSTHYLFPSAIFAERDSYIVNTVLGSCISVCLIDYKNKIGGINHYMLPYWNGEGLATPKYGNIAIDKLIERMIRIGASRTELVAKVFGGANQIKSSINIGGKNIDVAIELLFKNNIEIIAQDVGGELGRKIQFETGTGCVLLKYV